MCGLFGMTLPRHYPTDLIDRADAIALLGYLAEERGQDSSGVAVRVADPARRRRPGRSPRRWARSAGSAPAPG